MSRSRLALFMIQHAALQPGVVVSASQLTRLWLDRVQKFRHIHRRCANMLEFVLRLLVDLRYPRDRRWPAMHNCGKNFILGLVRNIFDCSALTSYVLAAAEELGLQGHVGIVTQPRHVAIAVLAHPRAIVDARPAGGGWPHILVCTTVMPARVLQQHKGVIWRQLRCSRMFPRTSSRWDTIALAADTACLDKDKEKSKQLLRHVYSIECSLTAVKALATCLGDWPQQHHMEAFAIAFCNLDMKRRH